MFNGRMVGIFAVVCLLFFAVSVPTLYAAGGKDTKGQKAATTENKAEKKDSSMTSGKDAKKDKVAIVNGTVITRAAYDEEIKRYEKQLAMSGRPADPAQRDTLKEKVLEGLVDRELLKQEAQKLGIKADDREVDEQIATLKKRFPSEADFAKTLSSMNLTEAELKAQYKQDMAIKKLIDQQIASKVTVTDQEAKAFYDANPDLFKSPETVRASHILIQVPQNASEADKAKAREQITAIQKRLQKGEDFAAVAKETSQCPSSAKGGDLDYFSRGQMVGPFEEAAFSLKPGEMSGIVETQFGYHLIKVTDKKDAGVVPYDEIKEKIEQHLKQQKVNQEMGQYLAGLKSKVKIETFLN
jgi:peptidyl-prolyl cis-trans isomerase C